MVVHVGHKFGRRVGRERGVGVDPVSKDTAQLSDQTLQKLDVLGLLLLLLLSRSELAGQDKLLRELDGRRHG